MVKTLKLAFMPNLSHISKAKWPFFFFLKFETYRLLLRKTEKNKNKNQPTNQQTKKTRFFLGFDSFIFDVTFLFIFLCNY